MPLRVAAIAFLNPAPLLYDFQHEPARSRLREKYTLHYTSPANCAAELHSGQADLGLIPIASLTSDLFVVPGCTIASKSTVRSILLLVKNPGNLSVRDALARVHTVAADSASRSSAAYVRLLFRRITGVEPGFAEHHADPVAMLAQHDAALLIGDPALLARQQQSAIDAACHAPLLWLDVAELWREHTGRPWVAAVWALRGDSLLPGLTPHGITADLNASREHGLAHVDELVAEWTPRLALPPSVIRTYLTENIHYTLDQDCLSAILHFRNLAAEAGILPPLPKLNLLSTS